MVVFKTSGSQTRSGRRKSTERWELAFNFATQCLKKFQEYSVCSVEEVEKQSCEAIGLLTKRHVHNINVFAPSIWPYFL